MFGAFSKLLSTFEYTTVCGVFLVFFCLCKGKVSHLCLQSYSWIRSFHFSSIVQVHVLLPIVLQN